MKKNNILNNGIPISISLNPVLEAENFRPKNYYNKKRLIFISTLAVVIAVLSSIIARGLVYLIDLFTNISFYGKFSLSPAYPSENTLGYWVILVPVVGGIIVGLMAMYGSKAIRGHGIPEAMEQILTNQSKIKPAITYLKPLSSAISIGTGGPFGAEGPIIATGGALGSTIGQFLKISHYERKVLLSAGATAGMSAIFGSPIAAIFLAIELLLFEFSARSIIPVALACITGAAGHQFLFEAGPVFGLPFTLPEASNTALFVYSTIGIIIGLFAILITKLLYLIEDAFEKLPVHWMWWPALGGLVVGLVGYFYPRTLGVGYNNITDILSGNLSIQLIVTLCVFKFISWIFALASGTSGGTLAPLLTIGSGVGAALGYLILIYFPDCGLNISLAALIGMSAMFAGASRALITSIIFALETTHQSNALLPLLACCSASYVVSFFLMENTIMTEKIARRGVKTPHSYESDILEKLRVTNVLKENPISIKETLSIEEARNQLKNFNEHYAFIVTDSYDVFKGIVKLEDIMNMNAQRENTVGSLNVINKQPIKNSLSLRTAVEIMAKENVDTVGVYAEHHPNLIIGILTYKDILSSYRIHLDDHENKGVHLDIKRGIKKFRAKNN